MNTRLILTTSLGLAALAAALVAPQLLPSMAEASPALAPPVSEPEAAVEIAETECEVDPVAPEADAVADAEPPAAPDPVVTAPVQRDVDLVICLDTSGSMGALIDSARAKLWDIVNEAAKREPDANLRVGLLTYGSPGNEAEGFVVRQIDLTTDLDSVYARAMALGTSGGSEYVGWALHDALERMSWSTNDNAARIIFVAGNESADQGRDVHDYRSVALQARERGIVVNAMYAGRHDAGIREQWASVAEVGGGLYTAIDMSRGTMQVRAPQDQRLRELNEALNGTYLPYGAKGEEGKKNQLAQDRNAYRMGGGSGSSRAVTKGSRMYKNPTWDLVDAVDGGQIEFEDLDVSALPAPMQAMTTEERKATLDEARTRRAELQKEIAELSAERQKHVDQARAHNGDAALDEAIEEALDSQL